MKYSTLKKLSCVAILGIMLGCAAPKFSQRPGFNKAFETVVGKKEQKTSAVKVEEGGRATVGAIIGRDKVLTVARDNKKNKLIDSYSGFEGRTFRSKVGYDVVKQDPKLNISLLETKKDLAGRRDILAIAGAKEGPCTVISLYDARLPETNSQRQLYNSHQKPLYPYERKGKIYDKDKVTLDLGGLVNLEYPKEIVTRDALGRIKKRAYKQDRRPDFWDYYEDAGSLVIQDNKLVGLITDSMTVVYSKNGKTKQRLDGEMITGQEIKKFLREGTRKVYVKVAADEEYRRMPFWKTIIKGDIRKASKAFKEQSGIEFVITGFEKWDSNDKIRQIGATLSELKHEVSPGKNDMVFGFTGQRYAGFRDGALLPILGRADGIGRGRYIIVTDETDYKHLMHEGAHLFGAEHVPGFRSIMNAGSTFSTTKFGDSNLDKVLRNKYINFHKK